MSKSSTLEWLKLGYSIKEAEELSKLEKASTINTTATFEDINGATEKLIELMKQYDDIDSEIIDKFNQIHCGYQVTFEELEFLMSKEKLT